MRALVTGSSGHLGEALVRTLRQRGDGAVGLDRIAGAFTEQLGTIADRAAVREGMERAQPQVVFHAATLHKPHVGTHARQAFVDTNVTGTLNLLEEAVRARVRAFVFTSTTSVFGDALVPPAGEPAAWITEAVRPKPKNIYGVTKAAAEELCELFWRNERLPCVVLRTARFFPEPDDDPKVRAVIGDENHKVNEYLHRRADLADIVEAHLLAAERAPALGFGKYILSATTPFQAADLALLRTDAAEALRRRVPAYEKIYAERGWRAPATLDRVYVNAQARADLGWRPAYDFPSLLHRLGEGKDFRSPLAKEVGAKPYHPHGKNHPEDWKP